MPQSGVIIGALVAAFVVYLMIKGRLAVYYNLLVGGAGSGSGSSATATTNLSPSTYGPSTIATTPKAAPAAPSTAAPATNPATTTGGLF